MRCMSTMNAKVSASSEDPLGRRADGILLADLSVTRGERSPIRNDHSKKGAIFQLEPTKIHEQ